LNLDCEVGQKKLSNIRFELPAKQRPDECSRAFQGPDRFVKGEIRRVSDALFIAFPAPALKGRPKFIRPLRGQFRNPG